MPDLLGSAQALPKIATPANPPAGYVSIYAKSDDKVYSLSSGGTETDLSATGGGGGGGGSELLASASVNAGSSAIYSTASSTNADVDYTNLSVTFTAPASGDVVVVLSGVASMSSTSGAYHWSLRDQASVNLAGTERGVVEGSTTRVRVTVRIQRTGLTPGNAYTYKWGHRVSGNTGRLQYGGAEYGAGANFGPATMEVWSL